MSVSARSRRSGVVAAFLSFLAPGAGQLWAGARRRGLLLLAPIVLLVLVVAAASTRGTGYLVGLVLQPPILLGLAALNAVLIGYRLFAIVDAYRAASAPPRSNDLGPEPAERARATLFVGILAALVVVMHGTFAYLSFATYDVVMGVFADEALGISRGAHGETAAGSSSSPPPARSASAPTSTSEGATAASSSQPGSPASSASPAGPAWAQDGRFSVLLVGADAGPGRWGIRTDTLILATVELRAARAALFGIPRNLVNVPLPDESAGAFPCRCYPDLLYSLYTYAGDHPELFPGGEERGWRAVRGAIEELTGARLDGIAVVDLNGFIQLVDALGGVDINAPEAVVDDEYPREDGRGLIRIEIPAGRQHMDGTTALRYARSRHQDSDYGRMERQQLVLVALRRQMNVCELVPRVPELVEIAKRTLKTDLRPADLPELLELAARVDADRISRSAFTPPEIAQELRARDIRRIREAVADAFTGPAPTPDEPVEAPGGPC